MPNFHAAAVVLALGLIGIAAGHLAASHAAPAQDAAALPPGSTWYCPMHPDMTAAITGQCPLCKMPLVVGNPLDTREYELDFSTSPAAVTAGAPFTVRLRVRETGADQAITAFEEVHDKRYHLFIISRDMSIFEHVHPELRPDGTWELDTRLPKPGYYTIVSDFLPTGGSPQVITRSLITADFRGDARSVPTRIEPDTIFEKTLNGMTARVDFEPQPLLAGEHGHLMFHLTDSATGQPVTDLQPYLGAFGHTVIMSEDQTDVVHSHPAPDVSNDISTGAGGPRVMFEGYFPLPGRYRAWTQFARHNQVTTFSFAFRVPTLEEAMRLTAPQARAQERQ
jgi:hypothetical protein